MAYKIVVGLGRNESDRDLIREGLATAPRLLEAHRFVITENKSQLETEIVDADIFFGYKLGYDLCRKAKKLKWVHISLAGVNHTMHECLMDPSILVTSSKGLHPPYISEHIISGLLYFCSGFDKAVKLQHEKKWDKDAVLGGQCLLSGKKILILGLGHIGMYTALKLNALGADVSGIRRNVAEPETEGVHVYAMSSLYELIGDMDAVVDILPLTPETTGILGKKFFSSMKKGSIFINVGRGQHVAEDEMIANCSHLRGLLLDATAEEPVPPSSPLWDMDNVLLTQHTSGDSPEYLRLTAEFFMKNLALYLQGKETDAKVDKTAGY